MGCDRPCISATNLNVGQGDAIACISATSNGITQEFTLERLYAAIDAICSEGPVNGWVLLDDCIHDKNAWSSRSIRRLFLNNRAMKIGTILTMSHAANAANAASAASLPPVIRTNLDYVFIMSFTCWPSTTNLREVYDAYAVGITIKQSDKAMAMSFDDFRCAYESIAAATTAGHLGAHLLIDTRKEVAYVNLGSWSN